MTLWWIYLWNCNSLQSLFMYLFIYGVFFFGKEKTRLRGILRWDYSLNSPGPSFDMRITVHCRWNQNPECGRLGVGNEGSSSPGMAQAVFIRDSERLPCRQKRVTGQLDTLASVLRRVSQLAHLAWWVRMSLGGWACLLSLVDTQVSYSSPACSIWTSFGMPLFLPCKTLVTRNSVSPKLTCPAVVQLHQSRKLFPLIFSWHVPFYNLNPLAPV